MKNLKTTILTVLIIFCCYTSANAQTLISLGGGTSMPSSTAKDNANVVNSTALNADAFLPLFKKGWDAPAPHKSSFGLNIGASYNFGGNGNPSSPLPAGYAVTGATSSSIAYRGSDPKNPGFKTGIGPQANFYLGKFIVSPMVLGEYFSMTQKEVSVVQTTIIDGQSYDFNLATMPETKTSGFAVTPKIRMQYMISKNFGFFADASYTLGPKAETVYSQLIPNGNAQTPGNTYELQQLQAGTAVKGEPKSTALNSVGLNFGVVIGLGKTNGDIKKGWDGKGTIAINKVDDPANVNKTSLACSCKSVNMYSTEYPSSGAYTTVFTSAIPNNLPSVQLTSGNKLHFYFQNAPYNPSSGSACYGRYIATVNGTTTSFTSYGPTSGQDNHIEIPVSNLIVGINTITIKASNGNPSEDCTLTSKIINVTLPATPTSITLTPECCVISKKVGSVTTTSFDGSMKYKIIGIPNGCSLKIVNGTAVSYSPIVNGSFTNCYFGNVQITVVDATTLMPVIGSTINGLSLYNYTPRRFRCMNLIKAEVVIDHPILLVPEGEWTEWTEVIAWSLDDLMGLRLNGSGTGKNGEKIDISAPIEIDEESGSFYFTEIPKITKTFNGKTTDIKSNYVPSKKHNYVGHVTLLK